MDDQKLEFYLRSIESLMREATAYSRLISTDFHEVFYLGSKDSSYAIASNIERCEYIIHTMHAIIKYLNEIENLKK